MPKRSTTDGLLEREQVGMDIREMESNLPTLDNTDGQTSGRRIRIIRRPNRGKHMIWMRNDELGSTPINSTNIADFSFNKNESEPNKLKKTGPKYVLCVVLFYV